jgi:uncharacterized repeat protein (TIGR03803 family)
MDFAILWARFARWRARNTHPSLTVPDRSTELRDDAGRGAPGPERIDWQPVRVLARLGSAVALVALLDLASVAQASPVRIARPASHVPAPSSGLVKTLYGFGKDANGYEPLAPLVFVSGSFYGTTYEGGASKCGTVFALSPTAKGTYKERVLHSFTGGADGCGPESALLAVGTTLYGTNEFGGAGGAGAVFSLPTTGGTLSVLATFALPSPYKIPTYSGLIAVGSTLYGTSNAGGSANDGTVYSLPIGGGTPTILYSFTGGPSDGGSPLTGVVSVGASLYGASASGGAMGYGAVFGVPLAGGSAKILAQLPYASSGLIDVGSTLYGTAPYTGTAGAVFSVPLAGGSPSLLYSFSGGTDGGFPAGPLTAIGSTLFGTAQFDGPAGSVGTIFAVPLGGGSETVVASFPGTKTVLPTGGLLYEGSHFYGRSIYGGTSNHGSVFAY